MTATGAAAWTRAAYVFLGVATVVALSTCQHYGLTWDEEHSIKVGSTVVSWYKSGFRDRSAIVESNYRYYGGLFDVVVLRVWKVTGGGLYETSHVLNVLVGLTGVALAYWIGSTLGGPLAGFLSAAFLWLTPVYYGHSFNNPKDIPFAVFSLASFAAITACWKRLPNLPAATWLGAGLAIGMTLAVRVGGILLFMYMGASWLAWLLMRRGPVDRSNVQPLVGEAWTLARSGLKIAAIAWTFMLVFWPYGQLNPILNPLRALRALTSFSDYYRSVRFNGTDVMPDHLPWTYVPVWFGVTLPEFYFIAAALGALQLPDLARRMRHGAIDGGRVTLVVLLLFMIVFPVASAIALKSVLYDGIRHLLFIVPLMAIAAGLAVAGFLNQVEYRRLRTGAAVLIGVSVIVTGVDMVRLHPYESVYFNRTLGGGLEAASARFETDYWGQSFREGLDWVIANYRPETNEPIRVANLGNEFLTGYYLNKLGPGSRFISVGMDAHPHIVLATTRWSRSEEVHGRVLHIVKRMDTPLCYVFEVDRPRAVTKAGP